MIYTYGQKVKQSKKNIKKLIAGGVTTILLAGAATIPAFAADSYCSQSGCIQSQNETICAGHGSFGAFGTDNNFGNSTSGRVPGAPGNDQNGNGANGTATGANNSYLCGSPQGNP
jgi:hypothetical protein